MTFFDRVKELVKQKNTTLKSFIEGLGMNYGSYNTLRKANNLPRADHALLIAQALNTSLEYLITGQCSNNSKTVIESKNMLQDVINKLDNIQ